MKFIKKIIEILEFNVGRDKNQYSEEELQKFANKANTYKIIMPFNTFSYAAKAKLSKNPDIVQKVEKAELVAFFVCLPIFIVILIGVGSWLFSGTYFAIVPIILIIIIIIALFKKKK